MLNALEASGSAYEMLIGDAARRGQGPRPRYRCRNPAVTSRHQAPVHNAFESHYLPLSVIPIFWSMRLSVP
jgi:hypothetical protein